MKSETSKLLLQPTGLAFRALRLLSSMQCNGEDAPECFGPLGACSSFEVRGMHASLHRAAIETRPRCSAVSRAKCSPWRTCKSKIFGMLHVPSG